MQSRLVARKVETRLNPWEDVANILFVLSLGVCFEFLGWKSWPYRDPVKSFLFGLGEFIAVCSPPIVPWLIYKLRRGPNGGWKLASAITSALWILIVIVGNIGRR